MSDSGSKESAAKPIVIHMYNAPALEKAVQSKGLTEPRDCACHCGSDSGSGGGLGRL